MSKRHPTLDEQDALVRQCVTCLVDADAWCVTPRGVSAQFIHAARHQDPPGADETAETQQLKQMLRDVVLALSSNQLECDRLRAFRGTLMHSLNTAHKVSQRELGHIAGRVTQSRARKMMEP